MNSGNRTNDIQFENENELRSYPFETYVADRWDLPGSTPEVERSIISVVSDISIFVSRPYTQLPGDVVFKLYSVYVGPGMISASFKSGGDVAVCSVAREDFEPYRPYPMSCVSGACYGMCSFGDVDFDVPVHRKYDKGPQVLSSLVWPLHESTLLSFVDPNTMEEVTGDVLLSVPDGVTVKKEKVGTGAMPYTDKLTLTLPRKLEDSIVSPCEKAAEVNEEFAGQFKHITNINGVYPEDDRGVIAVVFD